ncbi:MAG: T9SS type A sorting domain-containing protein, partial [Ignavibacteria bacterium]|nr:T9SS type A sorting domain-containing protein [Ignavibacteria bacterium]
APWENIGFIAGAGNSTQTLNYRFFDDKVENGYTYEYRLRQHDFDGRESFSNIVSVVKTGLGIALENNYPNPVANKTTFRFRVVNNSKVKLELFDMIGNLVQTLYNGEVAGSTGEYAVEWNGKNADGHDVQSGTYMYKLTAGDDILSKTLTVVR